MHKLTFFPLGNADCCRIDLNNGKKILFDYADTRDPDDEEDLRWDLSGGLKDDLDEAGRDFLDVVAFTHLDEDHYKGASDFFWLEYAKKYQGTDRIKIETMWVPAAIITEKAPDKEEARIIQKEARYRFKQGEGIRVYSRPERLKKWCEDNDIRLDDRRDIITDAGKISPEFTLDSDGVEFFVQSPFAYRQDANKIEDRNADSLVMHATFIVDDVKTRVFLLADSPHDALADIVSITRNKGKPERLEWDIAKLPHHCSYLSLSDEKGKDKTEPVDEIAHLYEKKGQSGAIMIATCKPIPGKGSKEDETKGQGPPHRQAAKYYEDTCDDLGGEFKVTMEHPKDSDPKPITVEIDRLKATLLKRSQSGPSQIISTPAPRAG